MKKTKIVFTCPFCKEFDIESEVREIGRDNIVAKMYVNKERVADKVECLSCKRRMSLRISMVIVDLAGIHRI
mgnify:CR=1 FL=1